MGEKYNLGVIVGSCIMIIGLIMLIISNSFDFSLYKYIGYFLGSGVVFLGFLMAIDIADRFG